MKISKVQRIVKNNILYIFITVFIVLCIPTLFYDKTLYINQFFLLANSFAEARLNIDFFVHDMAIYNEQYFVIFPPFPSIVFLPFVLLGFEEVNSILIALLISLFSIWLLINISKKLGLQKLEIFWVLLAFFLGSPYWYCLFTSHTVNSFSHIISVFLSLSILFEIFTKRRSWLLGFLIGFSFLTRQLTLFYIILVLLQSLPARLNSFDGLLQYLRIHLPMLSTVFLFLIINFLYNYIRFDDFLQTGYIYIFSNQSEEQITRFQNYGLFNVKYFFNNLYHMFYKGHNFLFIEPELLSIEKVDPYGASIFASSPFIIAIYFMREKLIQILPIIITIVIILVPMLLYFTNGWIQLGVNRYSMDFFPLLMILIIYGYKHAPKGLINILISYSVFSNVLNFSIHYLTK